MAEETNGKRYRINVSQTSTGKRSWDCTVELVNATIEEVLAESDKLVAELDKRYPPPIEK